MAALLAKPARSGLTVLGTVLGVGAFVAVLGLTSTASGQISQRFTALAATEVIVEDHPAETATDFAFTTDAEERVSVLNGVKSSGLYWYPNLRGATVSAQDPALSGEPGQRMSVVAASPGLLDAVHARLGAGRPYDEFHQRRHEKVALLGRNAAEQLGVTSLMYQPAVFVGATPLTVIGIIDDVDRRSELLTSVVVPAGTAGDLWGLPVSGADDPPKMLIETDLGAAQLIGAQAPLALRPDAADRLRVVLPPEPELLRNQIGADLQTLFLILAGICLVIGTVGIANTALIAVLERVNEIGLRRALGAQRRHIALQFIGESVTLGLLGGLLGTGLAVIGVVATAVAKDWTPVLEPFVVAPAPGVGALTGLVAGVYPAWRAARIEPIDALRR